VPESPGSDYDRGHIAGGIDARLAEHDEHFRRINGSIENVAAELRQVNLSLQRLADQRLADNDTVVATAAALKDAEEARRDKSERSWTPVARVAVVVSAVVAVVGVVLAIYANR
jgi:hypothetical protein